MRRRVIASRPCLRSSSEFETPASAVEAWAALTDPVARRGVVHRRHAARCRRRRLPSRLRRWERRRGHRSGRSTPAIGSPTPGRGPTRSRGSGDAGRLDRRAPRRRQRAGSRSSTTAGPRRAPTRRRAPTTRATGPATSRTSRRSSPRTTERPGRSRSDRSDSARLALDDDHRDEPPEPVREKSGIPKNPGRRDLGMRRRSSSRTARSSRSTTSRSSTRPAGRATRSRTRT